MKPALQYKLRGFFTRDGKFLPNGSNIVYADVAGLKLVDSLGVKHPVSKDEMRSYLISHSSVNPPNSDAVELIDRLLNDERQSDTSPSESTSLMKEEAVTAINRCNYLISRIRDMQYQFKERPNDRSIMGSMLHVNELLRDIEEFLCGK